jgi:invasion protein IalB
MENSLIRKTLIAAAAGATCATAVVAAPAAAQERALPNIQQAYPNESYTQRRVVVRSYDGGRRYGGSYYDGRRYGRSYHRGNGVGAGLAGLAAGAIIGGAIASAQQPTYAAPPPPYAVASGGNDWVAYCSQRYRSFDPASGTYLGYDGQRHMCE